ncbi:unnamed protein product, partial [Trichogramma brassicae]
MKNDEPFFMKSYPIPDKYRDKVSEEIDKGRARQIRTKCPDAIARGTRDRCTKQEGKCESKDKRRKEK